MNFSGKTAIVTGGAGASAGPCAWSWPGAAPMWVLCYAGNEEAARSTASECEHWVLPC